MFRKVLLTLCFFGVAPVFGQTPVIQGIVNAANYSPQLAAGVWVAIFGTNLAPTETVQTTLPLPLQLGGVSVSMTAGTGTVQLPLRYVSAGQINALIPFDTDLYYHRFTVTAPAGTSAEFEVRISAFAPAIFTQNASGSGPALVFDSNFQPVTQISTGAIVLYASGLGATNPPGTSAGGNTTEPFNRVVVTPTVNIGGATAQVAFAGLAPNLPGVYQLNVIPPAGPLTDNTLDVYISYVGKPEGAIATLPVTVGSNTANVTGKLTSTYPLNTTTLGFSPLLLAATFNASFDILPAAKPFNVVAACAARILTIAFNPAAGAWLASSNVPAAAERSGDFSSAKGANGLSLGTIRDFLNGSIPFPGQVIPRSRLDGAELQAVANIPLPNFSGPPASVNFQEAGTIPASGHFVIDGSTNSDLATFGGFVNAVDPNTSNQLYRTNACTLTVDGTLVSSTYTTFQ